MDRIERAGTTSTLWLGRCVLIVLGLGISLMTAWGVLLIALEPNAPVVCVGPFIGVFVVIYVWNVYWVGTRIAVTLSLDDGVIRWRAPFRCGSIAVADVTAIDSRGWPGAALTIHHRDGGLRCQVMMRGLEPFLRTIGERRPDVPIDVEKVRTYWSAAGALGLGKSR